MKQDLYLFTLKELNLIPSSILLYLLRTVENLFLKKVKAKNLIVI